MAWKETHIMDERVKFAGEALSDEFTMAELCRRYGISRKTGYKYRKRYLAEGPVGLENRSRAPHHHPNAVDDELEEMILALKEEHPTWGAKKLKVNLETHFADRDWPALSTINLMLDRRGLVRRRKLRRRGASQLSPLTVVEMANQVWGVDFKGWWLTKDGWRCLPFTLSDLKSRYLFRVQAVDRPDGRHIWPILEATFYEVGLPEVIRSDNGPPFATVGAGGLSWLAVQLVKAGVRPERIKPGKPQQNGRHERMHRTLKEDTTHPQAANRREQQRRFDEFRRIFNEKRPHEALGLETPAMHYEPSSRIYTGRLREPEYPDDHEVRRVRSNGEIKWLGEKVFLSAALIGEPVGLCETDEGRHTVHFGPVFLGHLNRDGSFTHGAEMPKKQRSQGKKV